MKDFYFVNKMNRSNEYFNIFIKILVLQLHDILNFNNTKF
jgi:hypothetical protein